jgi:hypothetical protein
MTAPSESPFEVQPVRVIVDEENAVQVCAPADATWWSVYERDAKGLPQWLADCGTEADARRIVVALSSAAICATCGKDAAATLVAQVQDMLTRSRKVQS